MLPQMRLVTLTSFLEVAHFVGLDPFQLLKEAGISPGLLGDPETRWAAGPIVDLLENSASRSGCESFGILMAECRSFASLGPLSLLLERLPTSRDVLQAVIGHRRMLNDLLSFSYEDDGQVAIVGLDLASGYAKPQIVDLSVAMTFTVLSAASGGMWRPASVHFRHRAPADPRAFQRFYSVPVEFESEFDGLACSSAAMNTPNPLADDVMARHAERLLQMVPQAAEKEQTSDKARRAITLLLPSGRATLNDVSANLGVTPRVLQRRLEREGFSFASLLNKTRRDMAKRYLSQSDRPITSIADLMGYSSLSAFGRWFVADFGIPPQSWRSAQSHLAKSQPVSYRLN